MKNKTLFAAALAFVMTIGGFALSAQEGTLSVKMDVSLKDNLTSAATQSGKVFGYKMENGGFQSLSSAMSSQSGSKVTFSLGTFTTGDAIQFGYASGEGQDFVAAPVSLKVASDPGYSYSYNPANFYPLDFSNSEFDGNIELVPVGTPLPASTVTLLVALGAAAAMLLYYNRRKQVRISGQA